MSASDKLTSAAGGADRTENFTVKEKLETNKKTDKNSSPDDQKPRIVLTFRTEKPGLKTSTMKIVSSEEKFDKTPESFDDTAEGSGKRKTTSVTASESDESAEMSTPKRSTRCRTKEYSDNVLANAIARKEKSYNEATPPQRPSRRIKPTAKVLANKELKVELENNGGLKQKNASFDERLPEEGVQTRRSARRKSVEVLADEPVSVDMSPKKRKMDNNSQEDIHEMESKKLIKLKKRHLSKLGLKAKDDQGKEDESTLDSMNTESLGDNSTSQGKLADSEWEDSKRAEELSEEDPGDDDVCYITSDEDCQVMRGKKETKPRRTTRRNRESNASAQNAVVGEREEPPRVERPRRACTLRHSWVDNDDDYYANHVKEYEEESPEEEPPEGDEAVDAARPEEENQILATCTCEETSNLYPAPEEDLNKDGLFCRAIENVEGLRVGCSHRVSAETPLVRAGPRTPWLSVCTLHTAMMRRHMCCTTCGLFCSRGVFYQCSKSHLFHLECGLPPNEKGPPGCPHCGHTQRWALVNRECSMVKVTMTSKNTPIYTPEQRDICTPAYLSFSPNKPVSNKKPIIPPDILPAQPIDLKKLLALGGKTSVTTTEEAIDSLVEAVVNHDPAEQLICKMAGVKVNKALEEANGGTLAHLAAKWGNLTALYLLQYAGASLDATDSTMKTPLMVAVLALLEKPSKLKATNDGVDTDAKSDKDSASVEDDVTSNSGKGESEMDDKLMSVIRYIVTAGCNVNLAGPDGMTALHMAAQYGGESVCAAILSAADAQVDALDSGGWSPLVWAAENKHPDVVRLLLSHGASPSCRDTEGNSVVHWCALSGDAASLQLLLRHAAADITNRHADTPLHVAARQGHYACVVVLLAHGARTDIENSGGELPVEVCTGVCQAAISLNMQMHLAISDNKAPYRLLSSDISKGRERDPIPCINEVDKATLPDFHYITEHVFKSQINIDNTLAATQGCTCHESCEESGCGCNALCVRRWTRRGRLCASFPFREPAMIFECNQTCACDLKKCPNTLITRATQNGATFIRCEVYRYGGARGWGLRASAAVPQGAPVAIYCGELLTMQDADTRVNDHYMFALQVKADLLEQCIEKKQLCLDAMSYGSAARFINHSCSPNLAPVRVFTKLRDLRLPLVTLFATRDIAHHEELTFDYGEKFWSVKQRHMKCECGTPECRYPTIENGGDEM